MIKIATISLAAVAWSLSLSTMAQQRNESQAVSNGRDLAFEVCAICHVVAPNQRDAPLIQQPTPSFEDIANDPKATAKFLRRFMATTHGEENTTPITMPHFDLSNRQWDDVIDYILSLRKQPPHSGLPPQSSGDSATDHR